MARVCFRGAGQAAQALDGCSPYQAILKTTIALRRNFYLLTGLVQLDAHTVRGRPRLQRDKISEIDALSMEYSGRFRILEDAFLRAGAPRFRLEQLVRQFCGGKVTTVAAD